MKTIHSLIFSLIITSASHAAAPRPNVLLIISDDQGFGDFGFNGNKLVHTPNLDRLAAESAVYRNFVVAAACSPSRSALFTGRDHLLTGVWGVPPRANMHEDETRMPAFFKASGYRTMHVGKLDCAKMGQNHPTAFGWDEWLSTGGKGYVHRDPIIYQPGKNRDGKGWAADIYTDYTLDYIRGHREKPWFASVAYIIPHTPWECDPKYSAPFIAKGCSPSLAECYGSIAHLDECIGRLLDCLKETGQDQRTIVAFLSDNGATGPGQENADANDNVPGEDWQKRNVAKLRGHKALIWENGIRVPLLVRWPGRIAPGDRKQFGSVEDILPTLLDLSGIKPESVPHQPFSGVSLRPSLTDAAVTYERPAAFRITIWGDGCPRGEAADVKKSKFEDFHLSLRGARFVYHSLPGGKAALYDLDADPGETTDVQSKHPEVAASMAKQCRQRWDEIISSGRAFAPEPAPTKKPATAPKAKP
jgi:arylsulfatase A-like enzyme